MPSPTGGVAAGSSPAAQGGRGQGRAESLVPLTVRQLHEAISTTSVDDAFKVNGEEVHNLTLLGKVVSSTDSATSLIYTINDGTGTTEVKMWIDQEDADSHAQIKSDCRVGQYVRVYGHLRSFQGSRSVIAFNIRPVTDFNEITFHFLEVVYCNAHNASKAHAASAAAGAAPTDSYAAGTAANTYGGGAYAPPTAAATPGQAGGVASGGSCQDQVQAIFNGPQGSSDQGIHVNDVVQQLNGRFTNQQVRDAVEHLVNEGHLYSTIDDDHFKSTMM